VQELNGKVKVLALISGGLDSTLAVKMMLQQGVEVEAVNFTSPFCLCDKCALESMREKYDMKIHSVSMGQEFLDVVVDPPHGYGSQMNPCVDCRILMLKKSKVIADEVGAVCIVTGEVLDQRPFSQRMDTLRHIEREANLEGMILRPLSAKLLPKTEVEKRGLIDTTRLCSIKGRRRRPQMSLADELGIKDYPCPSGGCLLTDPRFAKRLRDHLKYNEKLNVRDVSLLKVGRHFRVNKCKLIVGRNEEENQIILSIAKMENKPYLEVVDHMGPITMLDGHDTDEAVDEATRITVRYSDAPEETEVDVRCVIEGAQIMRSSAAKDVELESLRI
jgi:tRNA U34 2-thiouridine synthase MnmA/TrmU